MADLNHSDYASSTVAPVRAQVTALMNWAGALMSLALIAGLGYWGYKLLVRDVTGVPVVRALEGPMRIAPEDPGGIRAAYQGLAVNRIAAEGAAERPAETVVLAPPTPDLTDEDQPMAALLPDAPEPVAADAAPLAVVKERKVSAIDLAVAEALGESPVVLLAAAAADDVPEAGPAAMAGVIPADVAGITRSLRPEPRPDLPEDRRIASLEGGIPEAALSDGIDVNPDTIAPGTRLVQLGAYPTEEQAREEWDKVAARFGDFMADKRRVVQPAEAGGRAFYRLRVLGFEDLSESRRFCAVLVAGEASCIPVAWR